jgi:hypothetical protein
MITPVIITRLQWKAYLIFMCTNLAFIPLIYFCYPETANLTLEEIDLLYTQPGVHARHIAAKLQKERKLRREAGVVSSDSDREEKEVTVAQKEGV